MIKKENKKFEACNTCRYRNCYKSRCEFFNNDSNEINDGYGYCEKNFPCEICFCGSRYESISVDAVSDYHHANQSIRYPFETLISSYYEIKIKRLSKQSIIPKKQSTGSSGYDLYSPDNHTLDAKSTTLIRLDIAIEMPPGLVCDIRPRSGMSLKTPIRVVYGTIDSDYRGNVGVIIENTSDSLWTIIRGDRIAQAVFLNVQDIELVETDELSETDRGAGGFGSTGR